MREALKKVLCPHCGAPPIPEESYFDEQKLRMENLRLKDEVCNAFFISIFNTYFSKLVPFYVLLFNAFCIYLKIQLDRVSSLTSKYMGRAVTQFPPVQPLCFSSLDLTVGGLANLSVSPSLDLHLLTGGSSNMAFSFPMAVSEMEKPIMAEMAAVAMDELVRVAQSDDPLWVKQGGKEVLSLDAYYGLFPKPRSQFQGPDTRVEASRDTGLVCIDASSLVDMFLDPVSLCLTFLS
jgi:homeobox-leucine zipper protein